MKPECPVILTHTELSQKSSRSYAIKLSFLQRLIAFIENAYPWKQIKAGTILVRTKDLHAIYCIKDKFILVIKRNSVLFQITLKKKDYSVFLNENLHLIKSNYQKSFYKNIFLGLLPWITAAAIIDLCFLFLDRFSFQSELCSQKCDKIASSLITGGLIAPVYFLLAIPFLLLCSYFLKRALPYSFTNAMTLATTTSLFLSFLLFNSISPILIKASTKVLIMHSKGTLSEESLKSLTKKGLNRVIATKER